MKTLNELRNDAHENARAHGFKDASIPEDLMLMVSELAEALEDHRAGKLAHEMHYETKAVEHCLGSDCADKASCECLCSKCLPLPKPCGIPSEMADVVIRVLHFCGKHGIDIEKAVTEKMAYNATRPFMHGNKKI